MPKNVQVDFRSRQQRCHATLPVGGSLDEIRPPDLSIRDLLQYGCVAKLRPVAFELYRQQYKNNKFLLNGTTVRIGPALDKEHE